MARTADTHLKERILDTAQKLLRTKGEESLTLRAVARAAGTTTPTVYKRFPDKAALLVALALRERDRILTELMKSPDVASACRRYLEFASSRPHAYELIYSRYLINALYSEDLARPGLEWVRARLRESHGGEAEQYNVLAISVWLMMHGAASLLAKSPNDDARSRIRAQCLAACDTLLANAKRLRGKPNAQGQRPR